MTSVDGLAQTQTCLPVNGRPELTLHLATIAPGRSVPFPEAEAHIVQGILNVLCFPQDHGGMGESIDQRTAHRLLITLASCFESSHVEDVAQVPAVPTQQIRKPELESEILDFLSAVPDNCARRLAALEHVLCQIQYPLEMPPRVDRIPNLRVFAVRHQKRSSDVSFCSPLTEDGLRGAANENLQAFEVISPTQIYSSSILRCLQTIEPYIERRQKSGDARGLPVKIEYSIYEHALEPKTLGYHEKHRVINNKVGGAVFPEWIDRFSLDVMYRSLLSRHQLPTWNQDLTVVNQRSQKFLRHLIMMHGSTNETILLVSHATTIRSLVHVASGIPIQDVNCAMGEMVELDMKKFLGLGQ